MKNKKDSAMAIVKDLAVAEDFGNSVGKEQVRCFCCYCKLTRRARRLLRAERKGK